MQMRTAAGFCDPSTTVVPSFFIFVTEFYDRTDLLTDRIVANAARVADFQDGRHDSDPIKRNENDRTLIVSS